MKIHFLARNASFERWDWRNPTGPGIGGSETMYVEMAWRLAARGYEVACYAPVPDDCPGEWRGTIWRPFEEADTGLPGLWVIHRNPAAADLFGPRPDQELWHVSQDVVYSEACGGAYTEERCAKFSRILALCTAHRDYLAAAFPFMASRLYLGSNGIRSDVMRERDAEAPARDPKRLIWASSPDRGLEALLHIFRRAREFDPELTLHAFYGFDNWDKVIQANPGCPQEAMKANIMRLLDQPGVTWHGRVGQDRLHEEIRRSGIWCYPSTFTETSCITCMEAQALGAIPVCNPFWATKDNVRHGIFIEGDPLGDPLTRARYVGELVRLANAPAWQEEMRAGMMPWAREQFSWERQCDLWESWL